MLRSCIIPHLPFSQTLAEWAAAQAPVRLFVRLPSILIDRAGQILAVDIVPRYKLTLHK
jgi:hypothetical protein